MKGVYAPNGTLPLYGIQVYVPNQPLGPPQDGAICDRCSDSIPGYPIALTKTDENGRFQLVNVPSGAARRSANAASPTTIPRMNATCGRFRKRATSSTG